MELQSEAMKIKGAERSEEETARRLKQCKHENVRDADIIN